MSLISRKFLEARPTEVGKIKIGQRGKARQTSGGGTSYLPERLDYFVVTTMEREGKDGPFKLDADVHSAVGEKPRELTGTLMYPEITQNLHTEMCVYAGRRRMRTCDGVEFQDRKDGGRGPCQRLEDGSGCACKPYARLHLQLDAAPHMGGYYVYRTHGWASTNNLQTTLEEIRREFGTLYRAPVKLFMQQTEDTYMDGSQERTGRSWKVGIVLNVSVQDARVYLEQQATAALKTREVLMLEAGAVVKDLDDEDVEIEGELADEFAPPIGVAASVGTREKLDAALETIREQTEPPVVEGEFEVESDGDTPAAEPAEPEPAQPPEPEPPSDPAPKAHAVVELARLARAGKILTEREDTRVQEALNSADESLKNAAADWLRGKMKEAPARPARKKK